MANELKIEKKAQVVSTLCEGNSIRSVERITGIHRDTVMRLGVRNGEACAKIQDEKLRDLNCKNVEVFDLHDLRKPNAPMPGVTARGKTTKGNALWPSWRFRRLNHQLPPCAFKT